MSNPPPYDDSKTYPQLDSNTHQYPYPPQQGFQQQQGYPPQHGYPPQQPYAPQSHPPYQQPPAGGQYYAPSQPQHPQPGVVVITPGHGSRSYQSYCGHIAFACVVFWCFGCLCGLIAFILAMVASDRAASGHDNEARQLGRASLGVSIAGVVVFVIIVAITIGLYMTARHSVVCTRYCKDWTGSYANRPCSSCTYN